MLAMGAGQTPSKYKIKNSLLGPDEGEGSYYRIINGGTTRQKYTLSFWVKRNNQYYLGGANIQVPSATNPASIYFYTDGQIVFEQANSGVSQQFVIYSNVYMLTDNTAWSHIVAVVDTTQATESDRIKLYLNGVDVTNTSTSIYPTQNLAVYTLTDSTYATTIYPAGMYIADVQYMDNVAASISELGETNATTGMWEPIEYKGSYGTYGFHLDFSNLTSTTTAGYDSSGNGLNFTPGGPGGGVNGTTGSAAGRSETSFSVDSPTPYGTDNGLGGEMRGNYAVLDTNLGTVITSPINTTALIEKSGTKYKNFGSSYLTRATMPLLAFDCYWEITTTGSVSGANPAYVGICSEDYYPTAVTSKALDPGTAVTIDAPNVTYGFTVSTAGVFSYRNITAGGNWQQAATGLTGTIYAGFKCGSSQEHFVNFGQWPFTGTVPSGYKCLCANNYGTTVTTSGSFEGTGTATAGVTVWINGTPDTLSINGNSVTFDINIQRKAGGFELWTSSSSYNASGTNTYTCTYTLPFKYARGAAQD